MGLLKNASPSKHQVLMVLTCFCQEIVENYQSRCTVFLSGISFEL